MKTTIAAFVLLTGTTLVSTRAQGFIYDQQSADETRNGEAVANLIFGQPVGQSFTPSLSAIDFISLQLIDGNWTNGTGGTVFVRLYAGGLTNGTLIGSTLPVFMEDGFSGNTNFLFQNSITLTPGTMYYLQPVLQSGDTGFGVTANAFNYTGGTSYYQGAPNNQFDLWFREGIMVVPEPSSLAFSLVGISSLFFLRSRKHSA